MKLADENEWCDVCQYLIDNSYHRKVCAVCTGITVWDNNEKLLTPVSEKKLIEEIERSNKFERIISFFRNHETILNQLTIRKNPNSDIEIDTYINKHDEKYKESYIKVSEPIGK